MRIFNKEKLDELFNNYHAKMAEVREEIIDDNHLIGALTMRCSDLL